jgi:hypothetical protein
MQGQRKSGTSLKNHYFVVVPQQVIALDLAHAIRAVDSLAEVTLFRQVEDAIAALDQFRPRAVFVDYEPRQFRASPEGRVLAKQGIPVAYLGMTDQSQSNGAIVLDSPFSESTVATLLEAILNPCEMPTTCHEPPSEEHARCTE